MKVSEFKLLIDGLIQGSGDPDLAAALDAFKGRIKSDDDISLDRLTLKPVSRAKRDSPSGKTGGAKRKTGASPEMIQDYFKRLEREFKNDTAFESVADELANDNAVSKHDVERLFNDVFKTSKKFPDRRTKAERIEDMRRERLVRLRFDAA